MSLSKHRLFPLVSFLALPLAGLGAFAGCEQSGTPESESDVSASDPGMAAVDSETPPPDPCGIGPDCNYGIGVAEYPITPSLIITRNTESIPGNPDAPILDNNFQLENVLNLLISQAGSSENAETWLRRLWDTQNPAAGAFGDPFAPHCDDDGTTVNNFSIDCPRNEGSLAKGVHTTDFSPLAVVNRFDLAPLDGSHCGEYRIVYGMHPEASDGAVTGRNFIIFEGQLPNPNPECGIEACRPVVNFWSSLATLTAPDEIGARLYDFYFKGIDGFTPVIDIHHYGFNDGKTKEEGGYGSSGGQIRTNQFVNGSEGGNGYGGGGTSDPIWMLKEFQLDIGKGDSGPVLFAQPVSVKNNPFFKLMDVGNTDPVAGDFQNSFTANPGASQVASLASFHPNQITNLNIIAMNIENKFNAGQSRSNDAVENYQPQFQPGPDSFHDAVQAELSGISSGLTPEQIIERAMAENCSGCHEQSNGHDIGDGLIWPNSNKFTHIDEDGTRSQALRCVFLPHRQAVGIGYLQNCGSNPDPVPSADKDCGGWDGKKKGPAASPDVAVAATAVAVKVQTAPNMVKTIGGGGKVN